MFNYLFSINKKVKGKVDTILYYILISYILSLFIKHTPVITNGLMILILTLSIITLTKEKLNSSFQKNKILFGLIFFYLLLVISMLCSEDKKEGLAVLIRRLPLLILPISFLFINYKKEIWERILIFYAISVTIASIIGFSYGSYCYFITKDSGYFYNDNISEILGKQAVYFAFYVSIAIVIFGIQLNLKTEIANRFKSYFTGSIIWLLIIIFMLASRASMVGLILLFIFYTGYSIIRKKKYLEGVLIIFCLLVGIVIMSKLFPKTLNRFRGTTETTFHFDNKNVENHFNAAYDSTKWNGTNTRMAIWECAIEVWKTNPIIGIGIGDRKIELNKKYEEKSFWYAINTNKNTHNQYLDILMSTGLIGLMLFLILYFGFPIYYFIKQKQTFGLIVFVLLAICLISENMFDRYQGLIFIPFILSITTKSFEKESDTAL